MTYSVQIKSLHCNIVKSETTITVEILKKTGEFTRLHDVVTFTLPEKHDRITDEVYQLVQDKIEENKEALGL